MGKTTYREDQNKVLDTAQDIMNMNGAQNLSPHGVVTSPESDCNSNNLQLPGDKSGLYCSNDSTHDFPDFVQDNNEYQWFVDYG